MRIKIDSKTRRRAARAAGVTSPPAAEHARTLLAAESMKLASPVNAALAAVNGRATAFRVTAWGDVLALADRAEEALTKRGVPLVLLRGARLSYRCAGPAAGAYKYSTKASVLTLERGSAEWYLTSVSVDTVWPKTPESFRLQVSTAARDSIIAHALRGLDTASEPAP